MNEDIIRYHADTMTPTEELVGHLQHWVGGKSDDLTFDAITLISPPDQWPPVIKISYRVGGEHHVDEAAIQPFVDIGLAPSLRAEAELQMGIVLAHLDERGLI